MFDRDDTFSETAWEWLKRYYDYTCLRCKRREPDITLTADHVIPKSKYGPNLLCNIQPLCQSCNGWKGVKVIDYRPASEITPITVEARGFVIPPGAHITYQLQRRKCNKRHCSHCSGSQAIGHGPYWYAYWREAGKLLSAYVGRKSSTLNIPAGELLQRGVLVAATAVQERLF